MASPRPVPSWLRVKDGSIWLKDLNRSCILSGAMPTPVSLTATIVLSPRSPKAVTAYETRICPWVVNLAELLRKCVRICLTPAQERAREWSARGDAVERRGYHCAR